MTQVFWDVIPCQVVSSYQWFQGL